MWLMLEFGGGKSETKVKVMTRSLSPKKKKKNKSLLWNDYLYPSKFICWHLNPQDDGICRCGLWEVVWFRWTHEGGTPMMGLVHL